MSKSASTSNEVEYKLTQEEISNFKERFNSFDKNKDGKITIKELEEVEIALAMNPTKDHLDKEFNAADINGNGEIDFNEFCKGMEIQKEKDLKKTEQDIQNTFNLFDKDKNGFIDEIELKEGFDELGINRTDKEFDIIMTSADTNNDQLLNYDEFYTMVLNESKKTPNEPNNILDFNIIENPNKYIYNPYTYITIGTLFLLLFICIIRAIYKRVKRRNAKIYHALAVINAAEETEDQML